MLGPEAEPALLALHPPAELPILPACSPAALDELKAEDIAKAVKQFPPGSGAGPSGLMPAHIPQGSASEKKLLHEALAAFCTQFVRGEFRAEQRDLFCRARRIPISKKPLGIRPIAVGETLRRLAAKCLVEKYQAAAVEYLGPLKRSSTM